MAFKVKRFEGTPDFEMLEAAKLFHFPLEERDYKPYSQARVCFSPKGLHVQFHSFESAPLPASAMEAVFVFAGNERSLLVTLRLMKNGENRAFYRLEGTQEEDTFTNVYIHPFDGEDLQGVFWGGNIQVDLSQVFPAFEPNPGTRFLGNFYKICEDPARAHYGSFYPADFAKPRSARENLGDFSVIDF